MRAQPTTGISSTGTTQPTKQRDTPNKPTIVIRELMPAKLPDPNHLFSSLTLTTNPRSPSPITTVHH
eukprot:NODE_6169_length_370_cov_2.548287_g5450_i0.p2 GENE.NODE_6169_length_370_cov_2.548287_g5450_i0~~NODE_6169_length_370_cov_2.548287_g5450_i0.p2  ORF type:complete len:67 (-),score=7.09 NODE_6169_length_370_cov_2.548287_g5450_i0:142-342(-)